MQVRKVDMTFHRLAEIEPGTPFVINGLVYMRLSDRSPPRFFEPPVGGVVPVVDLVGGNVSGFSPEAKVRLPDIRVEVVE